MLSLCSPLELSSFGQSVRWGDLECLLWTQLLKQMGPRPSGEKRPASRPRSGPWEGAPSLPGEWSSLLSPESLVLGSTSVPRRPGRPSLSLGIVGGAGLFSASPAIIITGSACVAQHLAALVSASLPCRPAAVMRALPVPMPTEMPRLLGPGGGWALRCRSLFALFSQRVGSAYPAGLSSPSACWPCSPRQLSPATSLPCPDICTEAA